MDDGLIENHGLNLFSDRATAVGSFPHAMLGYDRQAVDSYVRELEGELHELRDFANQLRQDAANAAANVPIAGSDFGKLSAHTQQLLMNAEANATILRANAEEEAERVLAEAYRSAEELIDSAKQAAEAAQQAGDSVLAAARQEHLAHSTEVLARAQADSEAALNAAKTEADTIVSEAKVIADNLVEGSRLEAAAIRSDAEIAAGEIRQAAILERDELIARARDAHDEAVARVEVLLSESRREHAGASERLAEQARQGQRRLEEAMVEADNLRLAAIRDSDADVAAAKLKAAEVTRELESRLAARAEHLQREIATLEQRKALIIGQMQNIGAMGQASVENLAVTKPARPGKAAPKPKAESSPSAAEEEQADG